MPHPLASLSLSLVNAYMIMLRNACMTKVDNALYDEHSDQMMLKHV